MSPFIDFRKMHQMNKVEDVKYKLVRVVECA